jgi:hypothetical protein
VLGALTVKGNLKWALLIATLLSILLSWGKNFMGFTDFFIDFVPGYNKFRAVSMTLVIAEVTMPLLGLLGLAEFAKNPGNLKQNLKKFYIAFGITAGICLLFYIAPKLFFSFLSQGETQQFAQMAKGNDRALYQSFSDQLESVRIAIFRKDTLRSLLFIVLAAIPIFLFGKGKLKATPAFILLAALVVIDLYPIDRRYLNNDNFISKRQFDKPFTASVADQYILNDHSLDFRVANLSYGVSNIFNDASTSYFHKSIGGYHGAKLRRYQDLINGYLIPEISKFGAISLAQQQTLNMLNTKYLILNPNEKPLENPFAFGNAWTVNDIQWVSTPNEEFDALGTTDLKQTAILHKEFEQQVGNNTRFDGDAGQITLTEYKPDKLTYNFKASSNQLVVFSEIWSDTGWKLYIDGTQQPLLRADYLLRCAMVPAGEHQIVMEYRPGIWKTGNAIQLASSSLLILGLLGATLFSILKSRKKEQA